MGRECICGHSSPLEASLVLVVIDGWWVILLMVGGACYEMPGILKRGCSSVQLSAFQIAIVQRRHNLNTFQHFCNIGAITVDLREFKNP